MLSQEETWLLKEKYHGQKTTGFGADQARLKNGEPLAYVIGYVNFLNCQIWLDSNPLIPRVETEYWVEELIKKIRNHPFTSPLRILDLCAGSGCIGVAIAKAVPGTLVDFIELDPSYLPTIEKNCQGNDIARDRIQIISGNLFENLNSTNRYDFIISNPPYIDPKLDRAEIEVKRFEPHLALYGGELGLELIKKIIKIAPDYLKLKGELWLEHEPEQSQAVKSLGDKIFTVTTLMDQYQVERFSHLVLK